MDGYRAIVLDVGGVLLLPHCAPIAQAVAPLGISVDPATAQRAHFEGIHALDVLGHDASERGVYVEAFARALTPPGGDQAAVAATLERIWRAPAIDVWRQPVPGSAEALRELAAAGWKLAIVSNSDGSVERQLHKQRICQVGEGLGVPVLAIIDSAVVGVAKPAAAIFRHAIEPLGVAPEQAFYVGDSVRYDVQGARAAGLTPVHFDPYALCAQRADHAHVQSLREVPDTIEVKP
jgi:putative hydrolase of the HAD superfamily